MIGGMSGLIDRGRHPALLCVLVLAMQVGSILAADVTVITAGRIVNPESGQVLERHSIVIEGNRIVAVRPSGDGTPEGAKAIDLTNLTVMPGLIDTHTHLLHEHDLRLGFGNAAWFEQVVQRGTVKRALFGARSAREMLEAGFTTVRDLGNAGLNGDIALRDAISEGWVPGPRMMAATRAISLVGGQFDALPPESRALIAQEYAEINTIEDATKAVRQAFFDGADCIKIIADVGPRIMPVETMKAIVDEVRRVEKNGIGKRPVAAHAISDFAIRNAIEAGVDSIEHGYGITEPTMKTMAGKGVFLVLTEDSYDAAAISHIADVAKFWDLPRRSEQQKQIWKDLTRKRIAKAFELGVPIAFGSDSYVRIPGLTRGQRTILRLLAYADAGVSNAKVLETATSRAADLMGWSDRVGKIKPGMLADLIAVEGNPLMNLQSLKTVRFVMKDGAVVRRQ